MDTNKPEQCPLAPPQSSQHAYSYVNPPEQEQEQVQGTPSLQKSSSASTSRSSSTKQLNPPSSQKKFTKSSSRSSSTHHSSRPPSVHRISKSGRGSPSQPIPTIAIGTSYPQQQQQQPMPQGTAFSIQNTHCVQSMQSRYPVYYQQQQQQQQPMPQGTMSQDPVYYTQQQQQPMPQGTAFSIQNTPHCVQPMQSRYPVYYTQQQQQPMPQGTALSIQNTPHCVQPMQSQDPVYYTQQQQQQYSQLTQEQTLIISQIMTEYSQKIMGSLNNIGYRDFLEQEHNNLCSALQTLQNPLDYCVALKKCEYCVTLINKFDEKANKLVQEVLRRNNLIAPIN